MTALQNEAYTNSATLRDGARSRPGPLALSSGLSPSSSPRVRTGPRRPPRPWPPTPTRSPATATATPVTPASVQARADAIVPTPDTVRNTANSWCETMADATNALAAARERDESSKREEDLVPELIDLLLPSTNTTLAGGAGRDYGDHRRGHDHGRRDGYRDGHRDGHRDGNGNGSGNGRDSGYQFQPVDEFRPVPPPPAPRAHEPRGPSPALSMLSSATSRYSEASSARSRSSRSVRRKERMAEALLAQQNNDWRPGSRRRWRLEGNKWKKMAAEEAAREEAAARGV